MYKVYILLCADNSFYTGYTENLNTRIEDHNSKQGAISIRGKLPVRLVYYEKLNTEIEATKRERQIKGWSRQKKINLIKFGHPNIN